MKAKYKGPSGTGILEFGDDTTVNAILDELKSRTGINSFEVKYGPPMAMKILDTQQGGQRAKSLGLHGETLTIVPHEPRPISPRHTTIKPDLGNKAPEPRRAEPEDNPEDINVPWPEREGTLLLRVMPSDNSCIFTAFGGALPKQIPAQQLRRMMADYIKEHSEVYSEAVLGSSPEEYCFSIQNPDRWGGGIELSILSTIFNIQICTFDVQEQNLISFGEEKRDRCILVYSGIHYDRVAFTFSEFPHQAPSLPPEMDRTVWPIEDSDVLEKTQELVRKLYLAHYFTDTEGLILKCDAPGCEWIGSGQIEGRKHAEETGHSELSEVRDTDEDGVLRRCDAPGCDFMGQGEKAIRQHTMDTGHSRFSIIPDW